MWKYGLFNFNYWGIFSLLTMGRRKQYCVLLPHSRIRPKIYWLYETLSWSWFVYNWIEFPCWCNWQRLIFDEFVQCQQIHTIWEPNIHLWIQQNLLVYMQCQIAKYGHANLIYKNFNQIKTFSLAGKRFLQD